MTAAKHDSDGHLAIRDATPADRAWLRAAVVELQEHERRLHATRLPGEAIADAYLAWMIQQASSHGAVLVALVESSFAGFVAGWVEEDESLAETPIQIVTVSSPIFAFWRLFEVAASRRSCSTRCRNDLNAREYPASVLERSRPMARRAQVTNAPVSPRMR